MPRIDASQLTPERTLRLYTSAVAFTTLMLAGACTEWRPVAQPTPEVFASHFDNEFRVQTSHSALFLTRVRLRNDSLVGIPTRGTSREEAGVATTDVTWVDLHYTSSGKTTALVVGSVGAVLILGWATKKLLQDALNVK